MKKQPLYTFYWFGTCLRYLQDASSGYTITSVNGGGALDNIDQFYKHLDLIGLIVTKRVAISKLDTIKKELESEKKKKDAVLTQEQSANISAAMNEIRTTLDAEIMGLYAYMPTPKRIDIEKLLSNVDKLFADNVFNNLPTIARHDFSEGAKCIAFEMPTAAAFHILRATESTLRFYYEEMVKQKRIKSRMWGPIVEDLRKRNKTKEHSALNNNLDNIRVSFRNPTNHPEAIYDIQESQDLFSLCIDVVNRMYKVLHDNKRVDRAS